MFGFFKKTKTQQAPPEESDLVIKIVSSSIGIQLAMSGKRTEDILRTKYCHGYFLGVCDAVLQRRGIPEDEETAIMAAAFVAIFPNDLYAFPRALALADDPEFRAGQICGGSQMIRLFSDPNQAPLGLVDFWQSQRKASK